MSAGDLSEFMKKGRTVLAYGVGRIEIDYLDWFVFSQEKMIISTD